MFVMFSLRVRMFRKDWNLNLFCKSFFFNISNLNKNAITYQNIFQLHTQNCEIGLSLR